MSKINTRRMDYSVNTTVTQEFRERVFKLYPGLNNESVFPKLMAILLFSTHLDEETGRVILPAAVLADIEEKWNEYEKKKYSAGLLLKRFQSQVMTPETFNWTSANSKEKKARTAIVIWKPEMIQALSENRAAIGTKANRVLFRNGKRYGHRERKNEYLQRRAEASERIEHLKPVAQNLIDYMDRRSTDIYTRKFNENIEIVKDYIEKNFSDHQFEKDYHYRVLHEIERQPKPVYSPSRKGNTDRIFPINMSYLSLRSNVRDKLLEGWKDYDLRSSQLAICAAHWKVPEVMEFLQTRNNIWLSLFAHLGIDPGLKTTNPTLYENLKTPLKKGLYSVLYGMPAKGIRFNLIKHEVLRSVSPNSGKLFFTHPVVAAMLKARTRIIDQIKSQGYGITCFGHVIIVETDEDGEDNINSIMARQAQAVEMKLLLPILNLADNTNDFQIVLWAHDGFNVWYKDDTRRKTWEKQIFDAVKMQVESMGIPTELIVS